MEDRSKSMLNARKQLLSWASQFDVFTLLDGNGDASSLAQSELGDFSLLLAAGIENEISGCGDPFKSLQKFLDNSYSFGFLSYDLKNYVENLSSNNFDGVGFPDLHFFHPKHIIKVDRNGDWSVVKSNIDEGVLVNEIQNVSYRLKRHFPIEIKRRLSKNDYLAAVMRVKAHILRGDIYEMNFCQELYADNATIDPITTYVDLTTISPTPFSCFYKLRTRYLISASPERFIKKCGNKIISQPIKGTIRRGVDEVEDASLREELRNNKKEQSENVMIVDLVRNDLSRTAKDGSVVVSELFGIYPFRQVFQMISTVESELADGFTPVDVVRECFPMGSMTGAPKVRAMQLIEEYERTKRGLYSGAVGYFTPAGDFDFNVVIRSILYNSISKYLSFSVGSAITFGSEAELEYAECLVKAKAILEVLEKRTVHHKD